MKAWYFSGGAGAQNTGLALIPERPRSTLRKDARKPGIAGQQIPAVNRGQQDRPVLQVEAYVLRQFDRLRRVDVETDYSHS